MSIMRQLPSVDVQTVNNLVPVNYDAVYQTNPNSTTEVYEFKNAGITVATVTVIYTDATKNTMVSAVRT